MSNIAIKGATTGTGTFTIESPATNTDRTLVLPDEAGTVLTNNRTSLAQDVAATQVAIHVESTGTNQAVAAEVDTKVQWEDVKLDTHSYWDSTNHRFKPQVAGWYFFSGNVRLNVDSVAESYILVEIRKNNETSPRQLVGQLQISSAADLSNGNYSSASGLIQLNGSTDYVEMIVRAETALTLHDAGAFPSVMSAFLVRKT